MADTAAGTAAGAPPAAAGMAASELSVLHAGFIKRQSEDRDTIEYVLTEHLRMSGVYWGLTAMELIGHLGDMDGAVGNGQANIASHVLQRLLNFAS